MKKNKFILILFLVLSINCIFSNKIYADSQSKETIKVGLFPLEPYAYLDSDGKVDGYYVELFNLISKKMNVDVEYIMEDVGAWLPSLENREVDILLGASITKERSEKFIFNKYSIALENYAFYTNNNLDLRNFENLNGLKFGYIEESATKDWIFDFFKSINADIIPVRGVDYKQLEELMGTGDIDLMMDSAYSNNKYKKIYEFLGDQVYIAANKENQYLLDEIDTVIFNYGDKYKSPIAKLYRSYFNEKQNKIDRRITLLYIIITTIIVLGLISYIIPILKKVIIKNKIIKRLKYNKYLLYYQPIYNPMNRRIVGFEGLLRLKDEKDKLISPSEFIPEIEKNNMLFDVTIWIINRAISEYEKIKSFNCTKNDHFYISINLSIDEIKNDKFVEIVIDILNKAKLKDNSICLEIIERVGINDLDKVSQNIIKLKGAGFKIAIDDFGVEYSNLDFLNKLDADIIKIDKNYVDGLGKDLLKDETILFILRVAQLEDKIIVLEGVEEKDQDIKIRSFKNNNVLVQGYFYNKPMSIECIKNL